MNVGFFKKWIGIAALTVILAGVTGCATTSQTAQNRALARARSAIAVGDFSFALQRLAAAESYVAPGPEIEAEILYLRGICFDGLNQREEAQALFRRVTEKYPNTIFARKAREKLAR